MQSRNLLIILGILLGVGLLGFAVVFFSGYSRQRAETGGVTPSPTTVSEEEADLGEATEIVVEGSDFKFSPKTISVREGEKVRLTFKNTGGAKSHNLTVEGLGIATKTVGPGEEDTLVFTAAKSGNYKTFCSVGNHRSLGMEGELGVSGE